PWAIGDLGIRVIVAESFGEIFYSNCFRNGMLPIRLERDRVESLRRIAEANGTILVDLKAKAVIAGDLAPISFEVADDRRQALLNGWNDTTRILALHAADIARFEAAQKRAAPWLWT